MKNRTMNKDEEKEFLVTEQDLLFEIKNHLIKCYPQLVTEGAGELVLRLREDLAFSVRVTKIKA